MACNFTNTTNTFYKKNKKKLQTTAFLFFYERFQFGTYKLIL